MRQRPTSDDFRRSDKGDATEGRVLLAGELPAG